MDYLVHTDGISFLSGDYLFGIERRTEQGNQCVPVSAGCELPVVYILLSIRLVSLLVFMVGAFVGIDSDYFDTVLPYLETGRVSADSVPVVGDFCRVLKLCYLAAELSSLFLYRKRMDKRDELSLEAESVYKNNMGRIVG